MTIKQTINTNSLIIANGQFIYEVSNERESFRIERPLAEINIFDSEFYLNSNPNVAQSIAKTDERESFTSVFPIQIEVEGEVISFPTNFEANTRRIDSTKIDSLRHYVEFGAQEGRDPSPLFDIQYYLEQNSDVADALAGGDFSGDPLLHYVKTGAQEGRDPNPFFDSDYYLTTYTDVANEGMNPLEHYVLFGAAEGRDPSLNFDPDFYLNQYTDVAAEGVDPLTHFLTFGQAEGRLPTPEL